MPVHKKQALLVGISNYEYLPKLVHPAKDAEALTKALKKRGFKVNLCIDTGLVELEDEILKFMDEIKSKDCEVALVYFSGHGIQVNGENFLIPADMRILDDERKIIRNTYALNDIFRDLESALNKVNIIILDACRENPFEKLSKSSSKKGGLAGIASAPTGTFIAYATSPGEIAYDGDPSDKHGIFTGEILRVLEIEGLTLEEFFKEVRAGVIQITNGKQKPWDLSSLTGTFYFNSPSSSISSINPKYIPQDKEVIDLREKVFSIMGKFADPKTIEEAFNEFIDFAKDFAHIPDLFKRAIDLKQDYLFLETDFKSNLLTSSEFRIERREILRKVSQVMDEILNALGDNYY